MVSIHAWLAFVALTGAVSYAPGPNMLLSISHGLLHGAQRTVATACGLLIGSWVLIAASTAGFGAVLAASATAFLVVKWCGVAYLAWLGVQLWRAPPAGLVLQDGVPTTTVSLRRLAAQGFGVALSNPKAILYFTALFPQFVDAARPLLPQVLILAATFTMIEFCMIMTSACGAGRLAPWLAGGDRGLWINRASASVLLAAAGLLACVRRA
jgi:threonine/homoserine/homoserine lactone efflux protein